MLFLNRRDVASLLDYPDCIAAVEDVFRQQATGQLPLAPGVLGAHAPGGGFHIKTAALGGTPGYFAAKVNANFPGNPAAFGLPTIQGVIALYDLVNGRVLALLDSIEITILRTAAASAVAAKFLALPDAATVTICGAGSQGRSHLRALLAVRPLREAFVLDLDATRAERLASELSTELGIRITVTTDLAEAAAASQICVTCTPSRRPYFGPGLLHPGLFVAAVGADSPEKSELEPRTLAAARVVPDLLEQAMAMGDLYHALREGTMTAADIHGTLGQVVAGIVPARRTPEEIFVFDSTGTALQDVAAAAMVYQRAERAGRGLRLELAPET